MHDRKNGPKPTRLSGEEELGARHRERIDN
jgi:hypothetical protein